MKRLSLAVTALIALVCVARGQSSDGAISAGLFLPGAGDYDLYSTGGGLSYQHRFWGEESWGLGLSAGIGMLPAGDGTKVASQLSDLEGESTVIPLGVSALYSITPGLSLEAGLQYWLNESEITARVGDMDTELEVGASLLGLIGVQTEWGDSESGSIGVDVGYQFDLIPAEVTSPGISDRDTDLQAFIFRVSWRWLM